MNKSINVFCTGAIFGLGQIGLDSRATSRE